MAPYGPFYLRLLFGNLWLFKPLLEVLLPSISPQAAALIRTTVAPTMQTGSDGCNVLPQDATLTLNLRYYVQFPVVKNVMTMQIGANGIMYTKYNLQAYEPDLGVFYNQNSQEWGNNPYVDAFVNIQWKNACLFAKYCNVLHPFTKGDYFSAFNYIRPTDLFKFGLYWPFYVK